MTTTTMSPEMSTLKTRLKATWEAGDYGVFAQYLEKGALEFFDRLKIAPGTRLLDVACGAGQLTLPAARMGIKVTGLDLAANLVQQAKDKAAAEGLDLRVDEGGRGYGSLDEAGRKAMRDDLTALWTKNNVATDGSTRVPAEYFEVVGTRA